MRIFGNYVNRAKQGSSQSGKFVYVFYIFYIKFRRSWALNFQTFQSGRGGGGNGGVMHLFEEVGLILVTRLTSVC